MTRRNERAINIFGSKVANAHKYPTPLYPDVFEPFAGGAGYSLLHHVKDVVLTDLRAEVAETWEYLIAAPPEEILALPLIREGQHIDELECSDSGRRLISWCLNQLPRPTGKPSKWAIHHSINANRACYWCAARREQAARIAARVKHWAAAQAHYTEWPDVEGTWYIDPPYARIPKTYGTPALDYNALADWCKSRRGQVIVCEQAGADWLPFRPLYVAPTAKRFQEGAARTCSEAIWTNQ